MIGFFETYLKLNEAEEHKLQEEINELNQKEVEQMLEITTSWHEKGRVEGRQEGQVELILRQLSKRYGSLPEDIIKQIQKLDIAELNTLAEAILDFEGIGDLKNWLK